MKVNFHQDDALSDNDIRIDVSANTLNQTVIDLIQSLSEDKSSSKTLPINVEDRTLMIAVADIIALEVLKNDLTIYTIQNQYEIKGQLKSILTKLPEDDFIQVSKSAVINLDHLRSLEASFSGNMMAILHNQVKIGVSRRYLANLKSKLGM